MLNTLAKFEQVGGGVCESGLAKDSEGNFFGVVRNGGTNGGHGMVFRMTPGGSLSALFHFNGTNGSYPAATLLLASDGNFYGRSEERRVGKECCR